MIRSFSTVTRWDATRGAAYSGGRLLHAAGPAEPRRHGARDHVVRHAPRAAAGQRLGPPNPNPTARRSLRLGKQSRSPRRSGPAVLFSWLGVRASARAASGGSSALRGADWTVGGYSYGRTPYRQQLASPPRRQAQPALEVMMA